MRNKTKKILAKGNVLVVTVVILGIILVTALSMSLTSLKNRKASMAETQTNIALQNAQTGVEMVFQEFREELEGDQDAPTTNLSYCKDSDGNIYDPDLAKEIYYIELYDSNGDKIYCNSSSKKISDIAKVKSVGIYGSEKRAIGANTPPITP